jgi:hypothetical protein
MAISTGVSSTAAGFLCTVPPGPCTVVLSAAGTGTTAYVSPSTASAATASTVGVAVNAGASPVTFSTYPGSKGCNLYASGAVTYLISTDA